ncbi:MAG: hypothetical protein K2Q18_08195, partial [Bdellovibrionales bacterium]|nr:hypothetical protein [Bdellovibrionales bacterium]
MHKFSFGLFGLLFLGNVAQATNLRGGAELLNPQAYSVHFNTSMFNTTGYYTTEAVEQNIGSANKYRLIDVDLGISYGFGKNFEVSGFGRFRSVSSTIGDVTSENSGLESLGIEAKYGFERVGNIRYAIGAHYRQTLYSNASFDITKASPTDEIVLGDAGSEYGIDLYMTYLSTIKWDAKIGYNSPANELSGEIPYMIEAAYRFTSLSVLGGVEGIYSIKNDAFSDAPSTKPAQNTGVTGLFNSINREKIAPYLGLNYAFNKAVFSLKGQTIISGTSTDKGNTISAGLTWNSDGITPESVKIDSFKEYHIDGSVLKVSARGNFLRIDQGLSTDVEKGMKFDIYQTDYFGGNTLVG